MIYVRRTVFSPSQARKMIARLERNIRAKNPQIWTGWDHWLFVTPRTARALIRELRRALDQKV